MPKSRKKKEKIVDFQKVKLKVGKRKPRGSNVTETSFRTSTINITTQLEKHDGLTNKRNLSLEELLTQLNHYNVTVRNEALLGLLDLFKMHPEVMHNKFSVWIAKVLTKLTDVDSTVRHSLHLLIIHAVEKMKESELLPFFKIIIAHISCGMTHINEQVQLHALDIFSVFLKRFPDLCVPYQDKILHNFMDLVSKQSLKDTRASQTVKGTKIKTSASKELLSGGKIVSLQDRVQVLEKLSIILKSIFLSLQDRRSVLNKSNKNSVNVRISRNKVAYQRLYKYSVEVPKDNVLEHDNFIGAKNQDNTDLENIFEVAELVLPVLVDCWVEFEPGQLASGVVGKSTPHSLISDMKIILNTLDVMLELLWVTSEDKYISLLNANFSDFYVHFISYFVLPMEVHKTSLPQKKTKKGANSDTLQLFSIKFNFVVAGILCKLLSSKKRVLDSKQKLQCEKKLMLFINQVMHVNDICNSEALSKLLVLINSMLASCERFDNNGIRSMLWKVASKKTSLVNIIRFFSQLLKNEKETNFIEKNSCNDIIVFFIQTVAGNTCMLQPTSVSLIQESVNLMRDVFVMRYVDDETMVIITTTLTKITDPIHGLFLNFHPSTQHTIVEILYWLVALPQLLLSNLALLCHDNKITPEVKKYIVSVTSLSFKHGSCMMEVFISFLLTVVIGYSVKDLQELQSRNANVLSWNSLNIIEEKEREVPSEYAINKLKELCGLCELLPVVGKLLSTFSVFPVTAVKGVLHLLLNLSTWPFQVCNGSDNSIVDFLSSVLLFTISETYRTQIIPPPSSHAQLLTDCIHILGHNPQILPLLVNRWIHMFEEHKSNVICVSSSIEVLLSLLDEPNLRLLMAKLKGDLQSIASMFDQVDDAVTSHLLPPLRMQISLL